MIPEPTAEDLAINLAYCYNSDRAGNVDWDNAIIRRCVAAEAERDRLKVEVKRLQQELEDLKDICLSPPFLTLPAPNGLGDR